MEPSELREYTVRLQASGQSGTGFFVAPGLILTCAHVVTEGNSREPITPVKVYWKNHEYTAIVEKLPVNPEVDLALLQLEQPIPEQPCVSLDESFVNQDSIYSVGYTDDYPNGEPRDFIYTGLTGDDPPLMTFRGEQVQPGFSGAPLLNKRTDKICGLIKRSRDIYSPLGGRGVPVSVIFEHFPELKSTIIPENPFIPLGGKIDNPNRVFGREKEIKEIFEILRCGGGVALIGDQGSGKSSLLSAIEKQAPSKPNFKRQPVYLNMSNVYNEQQFYIAICDSAEISVDANADLRGNNFYRIIKDRRLLLILDDADKIAWDGFTNQVRRQIRALASEGNYSPFRLVVAARKSLKKLFADSGQDSPFEEICQEILVKPWQENVIRDFIKTRLQSNPISFIESEIEKIITESKGYPYQVMKLCNQLYREKCNK